MHTDYSGQGVDQLQNVIETIKTKPEDRRIIMSAWNPMGMYWLIYVSLSRRFLTKIYDPQPCRINRSSYVDKCTNLLLFFT